jgi:hypothetical protein
MLEKQLRLAAVLVDYDVDGLFGCREDDAPKNPSGNSELSCD